MPGRRWNSIKHTSRPSAKHRGARVAWDILARSNPDRTPKELCYTHADYWIWLMEFEDGKYDEVEREVVSYHVRNPRPEPVSQPPGGRHA